MKGSVIDMDAGKNTDLVLTESQEKTLVTVNEHKSELSTVVTQRMFEQAYEKFIEQAEQNAFSKKSNGSRTPYGFASAPECDGAAFVQHFGQGAASATPHMNWWVVSVYYNISSREIMIGIEDGRYPLMNDMQIKPIRFDKVGNRKKRIVVYYSTNKDTVNYEILYDTFITICEEVMRLGVVDASTDILPDHKERLADDFEKATRNNTVKHRTTRSISQRLRYKVLSRDNFKCCACGASPAKDPSVELHVDHIIPWSKGGETVLDNLQTLCSKCNIGKSDLMPD